VASPPALQVTFSFPEFPSVEGGTPASYEWSVGTAPGAGDAVGWTPFTVRRATRSTAAAPPREQPPRGDN
jgi:hypothetical protein